MFAPFTWTWSRGSKCSKNWFSYLHSMGIFVTPWVTQRVKRAKKYRNIWFFRTCYQITKFRGFLQRATAPSKCNSTGRRCSNSNRVKDSKVSNRNSNPDKVLRTPPAAVRLTRLLPQQRLVNPLVVIRRHNNPVPAGITPKDIIPRDTAPKVTTLTRTPNIAPNIIVN